MTVPLRGPGDPITVYAPDLPELALLGDLPANVELVRIGLEEGPMPDFGQVDLVIPAQRMLAPMFEAFTGRGRLAVVQTLSAGVDFLAGRVPPHITVCNARGVFDIPLAEWVIGAILALQRGIVEARDAQARGTWTWFEPGELAGLRVVIVGFGSIGAAVAERLRPFDVEITGVARTARDGALGMGDLDRVLPNADVVVNLLPLTSETTGCFDARRLGLLPDGTLLVNAGRGRTVDTAALVAELASGRLRAALDVTDPEPLPDDHPLWSLPNVLVSPHIAGDSPPATRRLFELVGAQVRRFAAGEPLENVVARYLLE
jgi:phosphoglycerate dehydrogenase-like enzyme